MSTVNVKVAVRCRPMSTKETERGCKNVVKVDGTSIFIDHPTESGKEKQFTFDHSYYLDATQEGVYNDLAAPILDTAFDGFNGTIFAYGQTGSGKTHSMMGVPDDTGVIPRLAQSLFKRVDQLASDSRKFLITCSYLEIYNEVIHDLLNPSDRQLKIRQSEKMGIYVEGLAELVVKSAEEIEAYIEQGNSVRKVAETQMNARSSRSHSCFTIKIEQHISEDIGEVQRQTKLRSKLNLVDLAGSERAAKTKATGDRLKEGAAINLSLSALGNVISVLAEGKAGAHIPYRNSKLTRLLQESLGGNSVTVMLAALSPADYNYEETLSTLMYASRAKSIKNATKKNEDVNQRIIRELRSEIDELRAQLERMQGQGGGADGAGGEGKAGGAVMTAEEKRKVEEMQRKIAELQMAKDSTWEERERLSRLYEEERKKNLESEDRVRGVMQGLKEETLHALKRLKALRAERTRLTKEFKAHRARNDALKSELEHDLGAYTHYSEEQKAGTDRSKELETLLHGIEEKRKELLALRTTFTAVKTRLKENEKEQEECRAEAAAKRMVVEGDEELRRKIEMEVHQKMAKQKEDFLEAALEEERARLMRETAAERERLQRHFGNGVAQTAEREYDLELRLLQETADKQLLLLQVEDLRRRHALELEELRDAHAGELASRARHALGVVREVTKSLQAEIVSRDLEIQRVTNHLQLATADIEHLFKENAELKRRLAEEVAWEPTQGR